MASPPSTTTDPSAPFRVGANFLYPVDWVHARFPVDSTHVIVTDWQSVRPKILDIIKVLPWAVLSVVSCSHRAPVQAPVQPRYNEYGFLDQFLPPEPTPEREPVVLIGAPAESQSTWEPLAQQIYSICSDAGLSDVRVLIESAAYPLAATSLDCSEAKVFSFDKDVPMGSSFGPDGCSASVGGAIKLSDGSSLLLSVFHAFTDVVTQDQLRYGRYPNSAGPITSRIPAKKDTAYKKHDLESYIYKHEKAIQKNKHGLSDTDLLLFLDKRSQENLRSLEIGLKELRRTLQELIDRTSGNQGLGVLKYGSCAERGCDWSLSSFQDRRIDNSLPTADSLLKAIKEAKVDREEFGDAMIRYKQAPTTVIKLSKPDANSLVFKQGRTTGLTVGRINALESDLWIREYFHLEGGVNFQMRAFLRPQRLEMVLPGDSGAWVINTDGDWVGSIVGHQGPEIALFVDAERIVDDIELHTGMKVVSPIRSGH